MDESFIEELPLRREDRRKKSFMVNAAETRRNWQNKWTKQTSNLRTKFRRAPKANVASGSTEKKVTKTVTLKTTLKTSPKSSQTSTKEHRRFKRPEFANKLKSIHFPKIAKPELKRPELPKFKMPERLKFNRSSALQKQSTIEDETVTDAAVAAEASAATAQQTESPEKPQDAAQMRRKRRSITTIITMSQDDDDEPEAAPETEAESASSTKKKFEFGASKLFSRFRQQSKDDTHVEDETQSIDASGTEKTSATPSSSTFSSHFATVPRTASKIKESIISKWNRSSLRSNDSLPRSASKDSSQQLDRPIRLAAKISMEDDEETLGILQTKERIEMAKFDEENRAIHEISKARETEFKSRKPKLTHQDSDLLSDESNRDLDWEECERIRNKLLSEAKSSPVPTHDDDEVELVNRLRHDSTFSTEETQSSGSSCDRRRTGVIEDIDDDEFFLRQRGVSQDNVQISQYISSAIREDLASTQRNKFAYSADSFNKSFDSEYDNNNEHFNEFKYDDYLTRNKHIHDADDSYDRDVPVSSRFYPRHEDDNILFYQNEYMDGIEQPDIHITNEFDDDAVFGQSSFGHRKTPPEVPKRKRKGNKRGGKDKKSNENDRNIVSLDFHLFISFILYFHTHLQTTIYRTEYSYGTPRNIEDVEVVRPPRKSRSPSLQSFSNAATNEIEEFIVEKTSPNQSRYTINIKETNGFV